MILRENGWHLSRTTGVSWLDSGIQIHKGGGKWFVIDYRNHSATDALSKLPGKQFKLIILNLINLFFTLPHVYSLTEYIPSGKALCKISGLEHLHLTSPTISVMIGPAPRSVIATMFCLQSRLGNDFLSQ
jgi:hypothetical protein